MGFLFDFVLLTTLLPLLTSRAGEVNKGQDQTAEAFRSVNYLDRSAPINFYTYFLAQYEDAEDEAAPKIVEKRNEPDELNEDDEDFPPMRDLLAGGPLENRKFVSIDVLPRSGKKIERSFRFANSPSREKRQHNDDDLETPPQKPDERLNDSVKADLKKVPKNFARSRVLVRYSHQLTAVEKKGDTKAKLNSSCQPTTIFNPDYCERASYPNKNKMVCNLIDNKTANLVPYTCGCKFYRTTEVGNDWKQMRTGKVILNGNEVETCLVPKCGVCNHRIFTGYLDNLGKPIYEVDVCQGHFQCDNTDYYPYLKSNRTIEVQKHCSEQQFLDQFKDVAVKMEIDGVMETIPLRSMVLVCAKPNPSAFTNYDEFKFYCLPKHLRDLKEPDYKPIDNIGKKTGEKI